MFDIKKYLAEHKITEYARLDERWTKNQIEPAGPQGARSSPYGLRLAMCTPDRNRAVKRAHEWDEKGYAVRVFHDWNKEKDEARYCIHVSKTKNFYDGFKI